MNTARLQTRNYLGSLLNHMDRYQTERNEHLWSLTSHIPVQSLDDEIIELHLSKGYGAPSYRNAEYLKYKKTWCKEA